ncbi:hypothetical protein C5167_032632 [Papaver somniferum]|uniref:Uncharacterized protein n=1 Tax=Papaver somniferum TaxID=3469 RepID=A0A4Y7KBW5_PAPSO|nr:hypothetical protein C5167_032632 [Papaver somniferum]
MMIITCFVNDPISEATENILTTGAISKIAKGQKEKNLIVQSIDATALLGEVEMLRLEINRLHLEMQNRNEQEKHEGEVLRLKLEMQNEQKKHGDQISQLKSETVQQYRQTENQIKVMKKELGAVKRMTENKEEKDADTKRDDESGTNFDKLDGELERIWL